VLAPALDRAPDVILTSHGPSTTALGGPVLIQLVSALAHLLLASPALYRWYERNVARGINPARWIEYSISSSLMIVVIAMLVGIYDVASLLLIFALNATMTLFGRLMELHNQATARTNWTAFWFGSLAGAVSW
jgi:Heliorhodopsin